MQVTSVLYGIFHAKVAVLPNEEAKYSLRKCTACALQYANLQEAFTGPTYKPDIWSLYQNATTSEGGNSNKKSATVKVFKIR